MLGEITSYKTINVSLEASDSWAHGENPHRSDVTDSHTFANELDNHLELSAFSGVSRIGNGNGGAIVNGVGGDLLLCRHYRAIVKRRPLGGEVKGEKKERDATAGCAGSADGRVKRPGDG